jgi:hypothetical protein
MMNKLKQQFELLVKKLEGIDWDEQNDTFTRDPGYNQESKKLSVYYDEVTIEYDFAQYIYELPKDDLTGELTEGVYLIRPYCDPILRTTRKLLDRILSHEAKIKLVGNVEDNLRYYITCGLRSVPQDYIEDKRDLIFLIVDDFDREFKEVKLVQELMIMMKQDAVLNEYPVFKWNASQADLFRYIQLGFDLGLLEDNRTDIGEFLRKYVVCYNSLTKTYVSISPKELKTTFYRSSRHQANEKFLRRLIAKMKAIFPEFLTD